MEVWLHARGCPAVSVVLGEAGDPAMGENEVLRAFQIRCMQGPDPHNPV